MLAGLAVVAGVGAGIWKFISMLARRAIFSMATGKLPPEVTPNEDFYKVSKNFTDPVIEAASWRLEVTGLVERTLSINYEQLKELPALTQHLTLECISNRVGGDLIGNAHWKGVRLRELLSRAGVKDSARKVVLYAADGYTDSIALDKAKEVATILAYEMNGVPLPGKHGFPARLLVPGIYGMKNVKWLTGIEAVDYDYKGYWQVKGWDNEATIKTMSRIDVPDRPGDYNLGDLEPVDGLATPGTGGERDSEIDTDGAVQNLLGGVAFAGDRGISLVEVSTDDGQTWSQAQVKGALSPYTWVLWVYSWRPPGEGEYTIKVRAADSKGNLQSARQSHPFPDGASGYHSVVVRLVSE